MTISLMFPYTGTGRHMLYGTFEIPECTVPDVQFDSFNRVAAYEHVKYSHGNMHVQVSADEEAQKIQVHDLVFAFWGSNEESAYIHKQTLEYIEELEAAIAKYNEFTEDKLVVVTTTFYSDNPIYEPGTKPRYMVSRISRTADFKERT